MPNGCSAPIAPKARRPSCHRSTQATGTLLAHNPYSLEFPDRIAFLAGDGGAQTVTSDRAEFIGDGSAEWPACVRSGAALSGTRRGGTRSVRGDRA